MTQSPPLRAPDWRRVTLLVGGRKPGIPGDPRQACRGLSEGHPVDFISVFIVPNAIPGIPGTFWVSPASSATETRHPRRKSKN